MKPFSDRHLEVKFVGCAIMRKIFLSLLCILSALHADETFSYDLTRTLLQQDHNVFFSPYSTQIVLSMSMEGAHGKTREEFSKLLKTPFQAHANTATFSTYQAVAIDHSCIPTQQYIQLLQKNFQAKLFSVDFQKQPDWSVKMINNWVQEKTENRINTLLLPQDVSSYTKLILLNAALVKKAWLYPFNQSSTKNAPFTTCDDKEIETPFMEIKEYFSYARDAHASYVELLFQKEENGPDLSCFLILPHDMNTLPLVEKHLSQEKIDFLKLELKKEFVHLLLPKCKINYRKDLRTALQELGLKTAFSKEADFTGISAHEDLALDKVIHQAELELDENGLTAAAATAAEFIMKSSLQPQHPIVMRFNRPFFILILDKTHNSLLFAGRICRPN